MTTTNMFLNFGGKWDSTPDFKHNLMKYLCAAFLPLTLFYFLVIILKISITSHTMVASVFICQVVALIKTNAAIVLLVVSYLVPCKHETGQIICVHLNV